MSEPREPECGVYNDAEIDDSKVLWGRYGDSRASGVSAALCELARLACTVLRHGKPSRQTSAKKTKARGPDAGPHAFGGFRHNT